MKPLAFLLVWVAFATPVISADPPTAAQARTRDLLKEAYGFSSTGRYDLAIKRCNQALEIDPGNVPAITQREIATRQKAADEKAKREAEPHPRAFYPTFPPIEIAPLRGPDYYK
jgi:hypothetical protein